ncbi:MAG: DUF3805 domain-containing protein [Bacteroidia bacterium]|nr:DUF3805 domain-containing protein [Bacteroidia bacterium]MCZ2139799.1 DUF3805 domain-containing protein [Bacteroidia bacterium]
MNRPERFVSLFGFFAFKYPSSWTNETDESGHYLFYNANGGQGVLRVMVMPNDFGSDDEKMIEEVLNQNREFSPSLYVANKNKFVHFVKEHTIKNSLFTVYYWATAKKDKVVLFALTVQSLMKELPLTISEREEVEAMIGSLEFLNEH